MPSARVSLLRVLQLCLDVEFCTMEQSGHSEDTRTALPKMVGTEYLIKRWFIIYRKKKELECSFSWDLQNYICIVYFPTDFFTFICISRSGNIFTTEYNLILFLTVILHLQILKTPLLNFRPQMLRMKFRKRRPILPTWLCPSCLVLQARGGWRRKQPSAGAFASVASIPSLLKIFKPPFLLS